MNKSGIITCILLSLMVGMLFEVSEVECRGGRGGRGGVRGVRGGSGGGSGGGGLAWWWYLVIIGGVCSLFGGFYLIKYCCFND